MDCLTCAAPAAATVRSASGRVLMHDSPHFIAGLCACQCASCYDTGTQVLDDICRCAVCPCVGSDHTSQLA